MPAFRVNLTSYRRVIRVLCSLNASLLFLLFVVSPALAAAPDQALETAFAEAREVVLGQKETLAADKLREKLEGIIFPVFDFKEMARRSLGPAWRKATTEEQGEYVELFSKLLSRTYYKKVIDNIGDSQVRFVDNKIKGKKALVKTVVTYEGDDVTIDYRLKNKTEAWRVYDVIIANVSLVSNYRSEFGSIVRKEKMSGLLERLRKKM